MTLPLPTLTLQQTIARTVTCSGVGLHGGQPVSVRIRPSHRRPSIIFRRTDLEKRLADLGTPGRVEIPASLAGVSRVDHATTISAPAPRGLAPAGAASAGGTASVGTIEHLVAALHGMGIDSCLVEVDGPEIPILDGSSAPWVELLRSAGRQALPRARKHLRVVRPMTVSSGESSISCYPSSSFRLTCSIDFAHPAIGRQELSLEVTAESFARELAPARTFGFVREVEALRAAGLARGGSLENAVVLDDERVLNGPLRSPDEFVRHKALDLVGDLALLGMPLVGHVVARRAGHRLHVEFAKALLADTSCHVIESAAAGHEHPAPAAAAAYAGGDLASAARSIAEYAE